MKIRVLVLAALLGGAGLAQEHWVGTWAASPQQPRAIAAPAKPQAQVPQTPGGQVTVGQTTGGQTIQAGIQVQTAIIPGGGPPPQSAVPAPLPGAFNNQTVRMIVRTSIGGPRARTVISNAHGTVPLVIGSAHLALRAKGSEIVAGSDRTLTFSGKARAWVPVGASVTSDPVDLSVPAHSDLAVSVFVPGDTGPASQHALGLHTTYIAAGDATGAPSLEGAATSQSWPWLAAVEVLAPINAAAIVALGDSITDGARSTPDTDNSWPSHLARRLAAAGASHLAVLNQGISGNRVLRDGVGPNALARFDRDVLGMSGVKWMILLESINDIGQGNRAGIAESDKVTADDVIGAMRQLIEKARSHGIRVVGGTLTAVEGSGYYNENSEAVRQAVNQWIRTSGAFDAVVDFDAATRDPANPKRFKAEFDSGDHLHPGDAGYKAMAEAIDLSIFGVKR